MNVQVWPCKFFVTKLEFSSVRKMETIQARNQSGSLDLPCPKRHKKRSVAGDARWIPLAQKSPIEFS